MKACFCIPPVDDLYPWRAVREGLAKIGAAPISAGHDMFDCDFLVTWSPWNGSFRQQMQTHYRKLGKPVIVMENGWLSPLLGQVWFQIALDGWNGAGRFPVGPPTRWDSMSQPLLPWIRRDAGVLVIGQRGHPTDNRSAPPDWHLKVQLPGVDPERIVRRGRECSRPFLQDLSLASEVHVWSSNAASWAVISGIPVIQHGPTLMVSALASRPGEPLFRSERRPEFERLAWAQFYTEEIRTGLPFETLLALARA